jgi:hypothetical protein
MPTPAVKRSVELHDGAVEQGRLPGEIPSHAATVRLFEQKFEQIPVQTGSSASTTSVSWAAVRHSCIGSTSA